jgi:hypothetical protein
LLFKYFKTGVPYVVDVASAKATTMLNEDVNANLETFSWYKDNENILVKCFQKQTSITR